MGGWEGGSFHLGQIDEILVAPQMQVIRHHVFGAPQIDRFGVPAFCSWSDDICMYMHTHMYVCVCVYTCVCVCVCVCVVGIIRHVFCTTDRWVWRSIILPAHAWMHLSLRVRMHRCIHTPHT